MHEDSTLLTAIRIAHGVKHAMIDPEMVVRQHLARIDRLDAQLNAFQVVLRDQAIADARGLARREDLGSLPLAGVPVAIKDNTDVAGVPTRHGSRATSARPATADDLLVQRLRSAGAIVMGTTRMPELAIWPFTESLAFGDTRNPWSPDRTAGGSSGGSAVAVAARMVSIALGSDGGGSIRVPAACCGVTGFKPAPGDVPLAGARAEHWFGLTSFGPIARTVEDAALMYEVLRGIKSAGTSMSGTGRSIAISTKHPLLGAKVDRETRAALAEIERELIAAGHSVTRADPPYAPDFVLRFSRRWLPGIAQDARDLAESQLEPRSRAMARLGRFIERRGWVRSVSADPHRDKMRAWLDQFDVLITPTLAGPPVPVGKWRGKGWFATMLGVGNWILTSPWNLADVPAATVPRGRSRDGLPIGVQVIGGTARAERVLAVAAEIERPLMFDAPA